MDSSQFICIDDKHLLQAETCRAFQAMRSEAQKSGISIDIASSFRSVERQLAIWNAKWEGKRPLYRRDMTQADPATLSDEEKLHCILTFSALPGASRHHWGTDIDVYDEKAINATGKPLELIEAEYVANGPCYPLHQWLLQHASNYGFDFPYAVDKGGIAKEPWHISHKASASEALEKLTLTQLAKDIKNMPILGKSVILKHLDEIYRRYVLNKGIEQ